MSKCTKGKLKWERHGNRCNLYMDEAWIGDLYVGYGMKSIEEMEANAKELVRRWNGYEDGGLVDELRDALKGLMKTWWGTGDCRSMHQLKTDMDAAYDIAEAALAKS